MKVDVTAYKEKLGLLTHAIAEVESEVEEGNRQLPYGAYIDLSVAKYFEEFLVWELDHPDATAEALTHNETHPGVLSGKPIENAEALHAELGDKRFVFHIEQELDGAIALIDRVREDVLANPASMYQQPDWQKMVFDNGYFRVDGKPVFTAGFNVFGQGVEDDDLFLAKMQKLGVGIVNSGFSIPLMIRPDGRVDKDQIQHLVGRIRRYSQLGFKVDVGFGWPKNREVLEPLYPGITENDGNFFGLDIDHPGMKEMVLKVMSVLMPALMKEEGIISWHLANEPFFMTDEWGPHTLHKYHMWLETKYENVDLLNTTWDTSYEQFDAIPHPKESPRESCNPGAWHDRVTFNNIRVTDFFALLSGEIRKYLPDALIHLKAQDNNSLGPMPNCPADGIDRELLARVTGLHGLDTRPLPVTEPRMAAKSDRPVMCYNGEPYGLHWLGQSFLYDYLSDLKPAQPIVDFEYHAFSINAIRIPQIDPDHARATLWLAHLHGLIANWVWYWHRRDARDPFPAHHTKLWFYGSFSTQPLLVANYLHTMHELNIHGDIIEALVTQPKGPVRLLVSKPSYNQNGAHIAALHRAYEGLCFHGLRVGFVTEHQLITEGIPADSEMIVIADVSYVDARAVQALRDANQKGTALVVFGDALPAYSPCGKPLPKADQSLFSDLPAIGYGSAAEVATAFKPLIAPWADSLPLRVNLSGANHAFGVMQRQTIVNGEFVLLLINVSSSPVTVEVRNQANESISGQDQLTQESIDGAHVDLPVLGVRLLRSSVP